MKYAIPAIIAGALAGCASQMPIDAHYQETDAGVAIVTLAATKDTEFEDYFFSYRRVTGPNNIDNGTGSIRLVTSNFFTKEKTEIDTPDERGNVLTLSLPPGDYEIYSFTAKRANRTWYPKQPFSIPFTIKAGQTVYVGHIRAQEIHGKILFIIPMEAGIFFYFDDQFEADIKIARDRGDHLPGQISNETPTIERIGSPLFVAPKR